ncbi:MAG: hypothetical protein HY738_21605 [Bacteroidia bacterium]|nr:hypothetical protein [Bacteroidia bacterium]
MRIDRDFELKLKAEEGKKTKELFFNVYIDILNLLNTANIVGVYSYTGNPDDDGYLASPVKQPEIKQQYDEQAYRNYYSMYINAPWNYSRPRTIQLGVSFSF